MCKHEYKNYVAPLVLNTPPRKMNVKWICVHCGEKGEELKEV